MIKIEREAFGESISFGRILGKVTGSTPGPTLIFIAGIHGNEPAGIVALKNTFCEIEKLKSRLRGSCYAISGNLPALQKGSRYCKEDLNRLWTKEKVKRYIHEERPTHSDATQLKEIWEEITTILKLENGPFYFMDLHTTSAYTVPFLTVNDMMLNRKYTSQYPCPIILGIEEYLEGPLLSYINEMGYVAFGFEGGQHDSPEAVQNHTAFIYLSLVYAGCIEEQEIALPKFYNQLNTSGIDVFYEIFYRFELAGEKDFKMLDGFKNFVRVKKNQQLAWQDSQPVLSPTNGAIFMPLYQTEGDDGFFLVRKIPKIFLKLSALFRKIKLDKVLTILPGVSRHDHIKNALVVNKKIARFFTREFFHLLGYRNKTLSRNNILMKNREITARNKMYENTHWY